MAKNKGAKQVGVVKVVEETPDGSAVLDQKPEPEGFDTSGGKGDGNGRQRGEDNDKYDSGGREEQASMATAFHPGSATVAGVTVPDSDRPSIAPKSFADAIKGVTLDEWRKTAPPIPPGTRDPFEYEEEPDTNLDEFGNVIKCVKANILAGFVARPRDFDREVFAVRWFITGSVYESPEPGVMTNPISGVAFIEADLTTVFIEGSNGLRLLNAIKNVYGPGPWEPPVPFFASERVMRKSQRVETIIRLLPQPEDTGEPDNERPAESLESA